MKTQNLRFILLCGMLSHCSTSKHEQQFIFSIAGGGAIGAASGAALSPNVESRPWNALIFGLTGALTTGALYYFFSDRDQGRTTEQLSLRERELEQSSMGVMTIKAPLKSALPHFVKDRLTNLVIEELSLPSSVSEDGLLLEPHKAYRIKQQPELLPHSNINRSDEKSAEARVKK